MDELKIQIDFEKGIVEVDGWLEFHFNPDFPSDAKALVAALSNITKINIAEFEENEEGERTWNGL